MRRRHLLGTAAGLLPSTVIAGCSDGGADPGTDDGDDPGGTTTAPPTDEPRDLRGIYVQPFREETVRAGMATVGDYRLSVTAAVPHRFWTVTNAETTEKPRKEAHDLHLMVAVWDPETGAQIPEVGVDLKILQDGSLVSQDAIYEMLSQRMGYHYGGNFGLDGDGEYTIEVGIGGTAARTAGAFEGRFGDGETAEVTLQYDGAARESLAAQEIEQSGEPGAVAPMSMGEMPAGVAPAPEDLPGRVRTETADGDRPLSGDCEFVVTTLDGGGSVADETYVAVSARTRYNGLVAPSMALSGTVDRDGETVFDGAFDRVLSPDLDYHYGTTVPETEAGDELTIAVQQPPQVARHEGYEGAFLRMPDLTVEL
jgi:hypothetical protein